MGVRLTVGCPCSEVESLHASLPRDTREGSSRGMPVLFPSPNRKQIAHAPSLEGPLQGFPDDRLPRATGSLEPTTSPLLPGTKSLASAAQFLHL